MVLMYVLPSPYALLLSSYYYFFLPAFSNADWTPVLAIAGGSSGLA